jgi:predicted RNA-binding Zn-ribbon protein involved in translation (DUF1610 family)
MPQTKYEIKESVKCRKCLIPLENKERKTYVLCPFCGRKISAVRRKDRKEKLKNVKKIFSEKYSKEKLKEIQRKYKQNLRLYALHRIGGIHPKCVYCDCDDIRMLEINHKFGGGREEFKEKPHEKFYSEIINFKRPINDLEIVCKVCNIVHYLKLKYGEEAKFKVIWDK